MHGELPRDATVLRLVRPIPEFIAASSPEWKAFEPSSADKSDAEESGQPVRVSVWDVKRTTLEQAIQFRGKTDVLAFTLDVSDFQDLEGRLEHHEMRIVRDPLSSDCGGANGHCGIEGLCRASNENKTQWKTRLRAVAKLSRPADQVA